MPRSATSFAILAQRFSDIIENMRVPLTTVELHAPYLLFLGDVGDDGHAKTAHGILDWNRERCAAQLRLDGCNVDLGLPDMSAADAAAKGVRTAVIGVAPGGGQILEHWLPPLAELAAVGIDIAAGMHSKLVDFPELVAAAAAGRAKLIDIRNPPADIPVGMGINRSGKRVLTVGTDCAIGKKYTALALHRELVKQGANATFRATGQTGIMISGSGIPMDSVVADFVSGAAEILSPDNDDGHWDVIEGQGALSHPSYAGVTLGLIHGSQPDAIVLCHEAGRTEILGHEGATFELPSIAGAIDSALRAARLTNPACVCAGISVNTSSLSDQDRHVYLDELAQEHGLAVVDPVATGTAPIAKFLQENV